MCFNVKERVSEKKEVVGERIYIKKRWHRNAHQLTARVFTQKTINHIQELPDENEGN